MLLSRDDSEQRCENDFQSTFDLLVLTPAMYHNPPVPGTDSSVEAVPFSLRKVAEEPPPPPPGTCYCQYISNENNGKKNIIINNNNVNNTRNKSIIVY